MTSLKTVLKTAALASVAFAPLAATAGEQVSPQRTKVGAGKAAGAAAGQTAEEGGVFGLSTTAAVGAIAIAALVAVAVESMTDGDKDAGVDPVPQPDPGPPASTTTGTSTSTATSSGT